MFLQNVICQKKLSMRRYYSDEKIFIADLTTYLQYISSNKKYSQKPVVV
jgi:hypothetical protein